MPATTHPHFEALDYMWTCAESAAVYSSRGDTDRANSALAEADDICKANGIDPDLPVSIIAASLDLIARGEWHYYANGA